jgi:hypothetical protein
MTPAGNDRRTTAVAVLEDFEEIMPRLFVERFETPIIQDQDLNMAQCALKPGVPAVAASERELGKQPGNTLIQNGTIVSASFVAKGTCQPALSDARGPADSEIVVSADPVATEQLHEERTVEAAFAAIIDIFRGGLMTKLGEPETRWKLAVVTRTPFPLEQQSEPLGVREMFGFAVGDELPKGLCHTG